MFHLTSDVLDYLYEAIPWNVYALALSALKALELVLSTLPLSFGISTLKAAALAVVIVAGPTESLLVAR
ncbi:hypothetical protein [Neobacillus notoginsengisoli]|nr:hypothetical protein [Neobacillus notoginsengisoli]